MIFGKEKNKALKFIPESGTFEIIANLDEATVHDETNAVLATALSQLQGPVPLGVLYCREGSVDESKPLAPTYQAMSMDDLAGLLG